MKKTMKKSLILALVIISMIAVAFCVSAATEGKSYYCSECQELVTNTVLGKVTPATCTQDGSIERLCNQAKTDAEGNIIYDQNGNVVRCLNLVGADKGDTAPGHAFVEEYNLAEDKQSYQCDNTCVRKINGSTCGHKEAKTEKDAEGNDVIIKYYKVTYINNFADAVKAPYCVYDDLAYIELEADNDDNTSCYTSKELYTEYVKEGTTANYIVAPYRMPDRDYGNYRFEGWSFKAQNYKGDSKTTLYSGFGVPVSGVAGPDYKVYAVFKGEYVNHTVTFYNDRGEKVGTTLEVPHGRTIDHALEGKTVPEAPLKADNIEYKFTFDYWSLFGTDTRISVIEGAKDQNGDEIALDAIYGDLDLKAHYAEYLKRYLLKYFDRNGTAIGYEDFVNVAGFGTTDRLVPEDAISIKADPEQYGIDGFWFDASYDYHFTGNWLVEGRDSAVIDINNVTLPTGTLDYDQTKSFIKVTPQYRKVARVYDLEVYITYDDDGNFHSKEVNVQVTDANGNPIGVSTLTEKDIVSGPEARVPTFKKVFKVKYSPSYRVVATSKNYKGEATPAFRDGGDVYNNYHPGGANFILYREADGACGCICHGLFKPVWVGILNILHALFKAEFVCCDDMFANIGDDLSYGPSKS